jgi:hypothetical protein
MLISLSSIQMFTYTQKQQKIGLFCFFQKFQSSLPTTGRRNPRVKNQSMSGRASTSSVSPSIKPVQKAMSLVKPNQKVSIKLLPRDSCCKFLINAHKHNHLLQ